MLPDKLKHQKLVEIGIQQGSCNRVQFPVVVVRPFRKVHDHALLSSAASATKSTRPKTSEMPNAKPEFQIGGKVDRQASSFVLNLRHAPRVCEFFNGSISTSSFFV
jgi:hypothetical protein